MNPKIGKGADLNRSSCASATCNLQPATFNPVSQRAPLSKEFKVNQANSQQFKGDASEHMAVDKVRPTVAADVSRRTLAPEQLAPTNVGGYFVIGPASQKRFLALVVAVTPHSGVSWVGIGPSKTWPAIFW